MEAACGSICILSNWVWGLFIGLHPNNLKLLVVVLAINSLSEGPMCRCCMHREGGLGGRGWRGFKARDEISGFSWICTFMIGLLRKRC